MSKLRLHTIIASTRPGRIGPTIAGWFQQTAVAHGKFDARLIDLADFNLPVFDEADFPSSGKRQHEHSKKWAASVAAADAFVFVMPEYNSFPPPSLINAIDYLNSEWAYKPASFVSYGFISGGLRSVQALKPLLSALKIVPLPEQVVVPMFPQSLNEKNEFIANQIHMDSAKIALDELFRWTEALKVLR